MTEALQDILLQGAENTNCRGSAHDNITQLTARSSQSQAVYMCTRGECTHVFTCTHVREGQIFVERRRGANQVRGSSPGDKKVSKILINQTDTKSVRPRVGSNHQPFG